MTAVGIYQINARVAEQRVQRIVDSQSRLSPGVGNGAVTVNELSAIPIPLDLERSWTEDREHFAVVASQLVGDDEGWIGDAAGDGIEVHREVGQGRRGGDPANRHRAHDNNGGRDSPAHPRVVRPDT